MTHRILPTLALAAAGALLAAAAQADPVNGTLSVSWYTHAVDSDFQNGAGGAYNDLVLPTLGASGLPVFNVANAEGYVIHDVSADNEIQWWTAGAPGVTVVGPGSTGTVTLPYSNLALYPPNGTGPNDSNGFQTAVFKGSFDLATASTVTFHLGADDDAYFYVDGTIVDQLGGIHGDTSAPVTTSSLAAGRHSVELFYADRHTTGAALTFGLDSTGIVINPVSEPAGLALLATGLLGVVALRRRA